MCRKTKEEIEFLLKDLPEEPAGLLHFMKPGDFYGLIGWEIKKGEMLSHRAVDHENGEVFHTRFSANSEVDWHNHNASREYILCLEGELNLIFEDSSQVTLSPAEDITIQKGVTHMAVIGNKPCQIVAITIPKEKYER